MLDRLLIALSVFDDRVSILVLRAASWFDSPVSVELVASENCCIAVAYSPRALVRESRASLVSVEKLSKAVARPETDSSTELTLPSRADILVVSVVSCPATSESLATIDDAIAESSEEATL